MERKTLLSQDGFFEWWQRGVEDPLGVVVEWILCFALFWGQSGNRGETELVGVIFL